MKQLSHISQPPGVHRTGAEQLNLLQRMVKLQQGTEKKGKNAVVDTSLSPVVRAAEGAVLEPRRQEHKQKTQVSFYHSS